jgi:hypothetical protein
MSRRLPLQWYIYRSTLFRLRRRLRNSLPMAGYMSAISGVLSGESIYNASQPAERATVPRRAFERASATGQRCNNFDAAVTFNRPIEIPISLSQGSTFWILPDPGFFTICRAIAERLKWWRRLTDRSDRAPNDVMFRPYHRKMLRRSEPPTWHAHATLCSRGCESRASRRRAPAPTDLV